MKNTKLEIGATLIETMVALFVLAIGVLGVMAMQINAIKYNKSASLYLQASFLANDIYEGMLLTPGSADSYVIAYDATTKAKPSCGKAHDCNAAQVVEFNIHNWRSNVEEMLPGGQGRITKVNDQYIIAIKFELGTKANGSPDTSEYQLTADI